ncbi:DNA repair ATPase [Croceivirga sp. JEA036]|uniref:DNA repair ATPase n=1 Tax=Croceivirga sp. JEA036 TaxID=2721162 RepID=UPI00143BE7BA|nr:DNA repair ATPase [Croceivirga sp. JEA036]NJB37676.1 AAA family ATPase [Croceivirga sp. JEA036]
MQEAPENKPQSVNLDDGTYEIIQARLKEQKNELQSRLNTLNESRKKVFGSVVTKLIANNRINTENNCIARDIITIGDHTLLGYNVHFGLRTSIKLEDVFGIYSYQDESFVSKSLALINDEVFVNDFVNLYKYYRNTIFAKFAMVGNYLHMVFQLSDSVTDIKTFKWLVRDGTLIYQDNRSEHEFKMPPQHEFNWIETDRDMQRYGEHPHVSVLDKVFVETVGGDLTIKIEDNTDEGLGIFSEDVLHKDQTLDDGQFRYAEIGNFVALEIKPFQEAPRYFIYNHKIQEVKKISSIQNACILLPNDQGVIYPNGYYLQSGAFKIFDNDLGDVKFQQKISSPNGEDFLYVFYESKEGQYVLMSYNVIEQEVKTPIICNGFTLLNNGELCYFKTNGEQTKHHVIQIWQTTFMKGSIMPSEYTDSLLYKIGNKDIVEAMAECQSLITLLNKEDSYAGLYDDLVKFATDILDSYYWIHEKDAHELNEPLAAIKETANNAIDEFEKVVQLRKNAAKITKEIQEKADVILGKIRSSSFKTIDNFVQVLSNLRGLRGEVIGLRDIRYIDLDFITSLEEEIVIHTNKVSQRCVLFLIDDKALLPYHDRVVDKQKALDAINKVIEAKTLEEEVNQIAVDLEMLIEIVTNLKIEDTSQTTKIIDNISLIFASINQLKSAIKNKIKSLSVKESGAEFAAQIKLVDQSVINYLDIASTPEKTDELLNKVALQLEDLEGKFSDFEDFISQIIEKREEVYNAFENRKTALIEARNKKTIALKKSADRIIKGVIKKSLSFDNLNDINGYFAGDLMVSKIRDIIAHLLELDDSGKAEAIETAIKVAKEDAVRKLKDKQDLYEDGENIIKLGKHKFGVNKQVLDLTIVYKNERLFYHLTGTDFYQEIFNDILQQSKDYWKQELVSENKNIYRSAYLAFKIFTNNNANDLHLLSEEELKSIVSDETSKNYAEGYVKGVHDEDAIRFLKTLATKHHDLGLLTYSPDVRAFAQYFWNTQEDTSLEYWYNRIENAGEVLKIFPNSTAHKKIIQELAIAIKKFAEETFLFPDTFATEIADYLFLELSQHKDFVISHRAEELYNKFAKELKNKKLYSKIKNKVSIEPSSSENTIDKIALSWQWVKAFLSTDEQEEQYLHEVCCLFIFPHSNRTIAITPSERITDLKGSHDTLVDGQFNFEYHTFIKHLKKFNLIDVQRFNQFVKEKHSLTERVKEELKLSEFKPRVLSSFVRNKLIDQVYFPLFGDNLAKQLGSVGDNKRTDRMGMLLLVSPPGYGKTTLMEYMANRLGLIFMKINGPAIGHEITSVDPEVATNSAAKKELKKLNLAFEMGNNVMLYLDDIQHCNPEFLQKFISLADGTRKIEGIYNGVAKTYDLRSKKFCVIMAGNPYTESGEKFQIPDMLANRADIYNLGDIIGDTSELFELSLIENSLTSNPVLQQLSSKSFEDVYQLIKMVQNKIEDASQLKGNHTTQEIQDYLSVLKKVLIIRDTVLKVNETYIKSAAMEDAYRTEPPFKLQGSYRDMNKLVAKIVPIMNDTELYSLLLSHYESESQTLTNAAEANLLKFKELMNMLNTEEEKRWSDIKATFKEKNKINSMGSQATMYKLLEQVNLFNQHLDGIQRALNKD